MSEAHAGELLARIDAATEDARREGKLEDPAAQAVLEVTRAMLDRGDWALKHQAIAAQCEVPASVVRKLFPTRESLVRASLQSVRMLNLVAMRQAIARAGHGDPVSDLIAEFGAWFEDPRGLRGGRLTLDMWAESCRSSAMRDDFVEIHDFWIELLTMMIEMEIGEGRAPFTPMSVASVLLASFDGLQVAATLCESGQRGIVEAAVKFWQLVRDYCGSGVSGARAL